MSFIDSSRKGCELSWNECYENINIMVSFFHLHFETLTKMLGITLNACNEAVLIVNKYI